MATYEYIKKRVDALASDRGTWEVNWQEILDYVMPRKADVVTLRTKGEKRTEVLFDSYSNYSKQFISGKFTRNT
jgi:hypothetical protein